MRVRTKRRICVALTVISLFLVVGVAGGVEAGTISLGRGHLAIFVLIAVAAAAAYKSGYMKK